MRAKNRKVEKPFSKTPIIGKKVNSGESLASPISTICSPIKFEVPGKLIFAQINIKKITAKYGALVATPLKAIIEREWDCS